MRKIFKKDKGITLIALIITVIIMLILAGVSISALISDRGLFERTQGAADAYQQAMQNESDQISSLMNSIDMYLNQETDNIDPTVAIIEASNIEETTFTLTAKGEDETIIAKYEFYINGTLEDTVTTTEGIATYDVTEKTAGTTYTCKVRVYDAAGNFKESDEIVVITLTLESFKVLVEITTNGMSVQENTEIADSETEKYYFSIDNGETWESNEDMTQSTYQYTTDKISNASSVKMKKVSITGKIEISSATEFVYQYTGTYHPFVVQKDGTYLLEVYGAFGGGDGKGGYAKGNKVCSAGDVLYVYVGERGQVPSGTTGGRATFNGGGAGGNGYGAYNGGFSRGGISGGGATDIRLSGGAWNDATSLNSRIIVAGGGGGNAGAWSTGAPGGGVSGGSARSYGGTSTSGGTQSSGYAKGQGQAGKSKTGVYANYGAEGNGGGGGGYYGGYSPQITGYGSDSGGAGGSGYIGGVTDGSMQSGVRSDNGYAKITLNES